MKYNNDTMDLFSDDIDINLDLNTVINDDSTEDSDTDQKDNNDQSDKDNDQNDSSEDTDNKSDSEGVASSDDRSGEEDDESSPNFYSSLANALTEQGLLPSLDLNNTKIESIEDFTTAFKKEIEVAVKENLITKLGKEGYEAIDKGISVQEYKSYEQELSSLNQINDLLLETDIELSKKVVYQDLINQGLSENKAKTFLERTIELGEDKLVEDAKESLNNIKQYTTNKIESRKIEEETKLLESQKEEEKAIAALKDTVYKTTEIIDGIAINKTVQDKVYKTMTEIVGNDPNGSPENKFMRDRREKPLEIDTKIYYLYTITNGFKDFSKLSTTIKTNAISDLERAFKQNSFKTQGNDPDFIKDSESYSGFGDEIVF